MKKKILTGLVLLVFCSIGVFGGFPAGAAGEAAIGNTYYVSTMGADDNDGRSPSAPWKTLAKVSSQVFQPGDQILLRGGDEWVGEQLNLQGSGTAQNPILLSAYGTGRPKISNADPTLVLTNRSGWTIRGLELHNTCETPMTGGGNIIPTVSVQFTNSGVYHSLTIEDNLIYGDSHDRNTRGITLMAIYPGREEEVAFDIQISDNELHDVGWDAIMAYGWDTITDSNSVTSALYRNVDILRNQIYRTGNSGIILGTANHAAVKWNELHDIGIYEGEGNSLGSAGIISIVTSHVDILFNEVSRVSDSSSGNDGEGIDVDWQTEFNRVLYNHCYDNMGPGIGTMSNTHTTIQKNRVSGSRGLTAVGQGQITMTDFRVPSASLRGVNFLDLSDNLILIDEPGTQGIATSLGSGDPWTNNYVASNRFVLSPAVENISVFQFGAASQISSSNQNLVFSSNGSTFAASSNGQSYDSLASWQAGTGWDADTVLAPLDTQAPQSVTGLTATVRPSGRGVELTWDANGGQVDHYNLFRSTEANFEPGYTNMIGQTSQTEFTDAQELRGLTTYYYKVHAEDQIGNSGGNSQEVSVSIGALEPEDPLRYCASEDFSVIRQGPTWRYQSGTQGEYADIPQFDLSWNAWHIGGSEAFVAAYSQMPGADRDSVRTFSVPLDGTLELDPAGIQLAGPAEGSDGVLVRILHNGEPIWPSAGWQDVTWDTPAQSPQLTLQVKRGEELQFVVNRNETTAGDIVIWDPVLHLTEIVLPPDRPVMPPPYDYGLPQPLTRGLFAQDFDGGSAEGFTALSGTWQVEPDPDGGYRYRQSGTSPALAVAGETDWSEYTVSGDIEPIQLGPDGAVGICAMVQAADRCYRVQLNADNTIGIYKTFDGTESLLGSAPYPVTEGQRY